ncbi:MAG: hypothetical protein KAS90_00580 [Candidatus Aenigmarchaeota archaeon]|nr:hypothetical protein [Candidatus Aenigmarchaeota archaeon]
MIFMNNEELAALSAIMSNAVTTAIPNYENDAENPFLFLTTMDEFRTYNGKTLRQITRPDECFSNPVDDRVSNRKLRFENVGDEEYLVVDYMFNPTERHMAFVVGSLKELSMGTMIYPVLNKDAEITDKITKILQAEQGYGYVIFSPVPDYVKNDIYDSRIMGLNNIVGRTSS